MNIILNQGVKQFIIFKPKTGDNGRFEKLWKIMEIWKYRKIMGDMKILG